MGEITALVASVKLGVLVGLGIVVWLGFVVLCCLFVAINRQP